MDVFLVACVTSLLFFFNDTATTEIYTLSLHDALPISRRRRYCPVDCLSTSVRTAPCQWDWRRAAWAASAWLHLPGAYQARSEEHTSELQSQSNLVCRLLLEKKKYITHHIAIQRIINEE